MWNKVTEVIPPDMTLEVRNENGDIARAVPTYYPFTYCSESGKVEPCEPYWDGGWLIELSLSDVKFETPVVEWRLLEC